MSEPAFHGVGREPGMELWRIENLRPVKQPQVNGKFHVGDSYILLVTSKTKSNALSHAIHFWLGAETSQDEAGIAAYKSVELDDALGGGPVQYREVQGNESALFLSYFKHSGGVEYLPGGVDSGFRHVERDSWPVRLLHVKGQRSVRVREVPLALASLNRGDVFILDKGLTIYLFNGTEANKQERLKGLEVATRINADERGGRAELVLIDDEPRHAEFWTHFGGYAADELPAGERDSEFERAAAAHSLQRALFRISDATGELVFEEVTPADRKLKKELLDGNDIFLLQSPQGKIFLWVGRGSNLNEKKEATQLAVKHLQVLGLPSTTPIERVSEGAETGAFKSEFAVWDAPRKFGHVSKASAAQTESLPVDVQALLHRKSEEDKPLDNGNGKLTVWRIKDFKKVAVEESQHGQFFSGDCYILLYSYVKPPRKSEEHVIYFWLGRDSTADEKGAAALLAVELDDSMGGKPVQVRVVQGKEPAHFRQLFKGKMVVFEGGHASGFKSTAEKEKDLSEVALFHVKGTSALNTMALQVPLSAAQLNSDDAFVLVANDHVYSWLGNGSNADEHAVAHNVATQLAHSYRGDGGRKVSTVREGEEDAHFWDLLGGKCEYAQRAPGESAPRDARLFSASTATGRFRVEELDNFDQSDLNDEDVFLLDTYTQLFVWVGSQSTEEEKSKAMQFAQEFVAQADDGRDKDMPIIRIAAGEEPSMFSSHFFGWDPEFTQKRKFQDPYQARLEALAAEKVKKTASPAKPAVALKPTPKPAAGAAPAPVPLVETAAVLPPAAPTVTYTVTAGAFSWEQLKHALPEGVDPAQKEEYLSDAEFAQVFGMDKAAFRAMPKWKRDQNKKNKGLF